MIRLFFFLLPLLILVNSFIFGLFYQSSTVNDLHTNIDTTIVFFGTTPTINGTTNIYFQSRLEKIQELFQKLPNSTLLISGFHTEHYSEIDYMLEAALEKGISRSQVITHYADDTFDTIRQLKKMQDTNPETQIILVSQKFHLERANILAKFLNLEVLNIEVANFKSGPSLKILIREYFARIKAYKDLAHYLFKY